MFVKADNKVVNLTGCTSVANKSGKLTVFYGDKSELIGTYSESEANKHLTAIFESLSRGESAITL